MLGPNAMTERSVSACSRLHSKSFYLFIVLGSLGPRTEVSASRALGGEMRLGRYSGGGVVEAGEGEWICWGGRELV